MRALFRSINLLNLLLLGIVAALATFVLFPLLTTKVTYKPSAVKPAPAVPQEATAPALSPPAPDYLIVAEQNLFHPERKIPPEAKDEKALPKPEILLYGTLITDTVRLAYVEDKKSPQSTPGRGKRQTVVKQGDLVSGFVLKEVEADKIVLTRGQEQIVVHLTDAEKQRTPAPAATPGGPGGARPVPPTAGAQAGGMPVPSAGPMSSPIVASPVQPVPQQGTAAASATSPTSRRPSTMPRRPNSTSLPGAQQ
jgi:hypothetical protein